MHPFFTQLYYRRVGRAVAVYAIIAGAVVAGAAKLFPSWNLPNWSLPALIVAVLAMFPVLLAYSWHYDFAGAKMHRTLLPGVGGPASALPVVIIGTLVAVGAGVFSVPRANEFMAKAKTPTDIEVIRKVKEAIGRVTDYPGGPQRIPGATKLHGPSSPKQESLGLDRPSDLSVIVDLNDYIHQFQPRHQIEEDEYSQRKTVGDLIELVKVKVKPDTPA